MPGFVVVCWMLSNGDVMYRLFLLGRSDTETSDNKSDVTAWMSRIR